MGPRIRLGTDRPGALSRSSPAAPPRPRSTLSAPPALPPASYTHPSHPVHPAHRSRSRSPPRAAHTHRLRGSRPPHPSSPVYAQALRGCPLTSTRVEGGAPRRRSGEGLAQAGRGYALTPGGWPGATLGGRCGASKAVWPGVEKARLQWGDFSEAIYGQILGDRIAQLICRIT